MENLRYDVNGNLLTSTFSDYCPITMLNMPNVRYGNRRVAVAFYL